MESKTISTDRCFRLSDERAILEGNLSLPYDTADFAGILDISGCAEIISASAENDHISLCGNARYTILYSAKDGSLDSFDSECGFEHTIPLNEASADMRICANAHVCEVNWRTEGSSIALRSSLSIDVSAVLPVSRNIIVADKQDELECDRCTAETISCSCKNIKAYANGDVRIPQNMPEIQKILLVRANAALRSLGKESERIIAEGELCVSIIYESKDSHAPLQFFTETLSFGEIIKDPACTEESVIFADLSVDRITAELTDTDSVSISGVISINTLCINKRPQEFICDLYSLKNHTETTNCDIPICYPQMLDCIKKTIRMDAQIPESAPEAARILYAASIPEIISIMHEDHQLSIDGIMHISLVYSTADAGLKSIHLREPFDLQLGRLPNVSFVRSFCEYTTAHGSGRLIDLRIGLSLCLCGEDFHSISAVESVSTSEFTEKHTSGMIVYFADDGERIWDICKKYCVAQNDAVPLDGTELHRGDRVLLMR